jgi:hypothetical protein
MTHRMILQVASVWLHPNRDEGSVGFFPLQPNVVASDMVKISLPKAVLELIVIGSQYSVTLEELPHRSAK